jgi:Fungal Zn(2)-Cys(6) binuclear cluster domain
LCAPARINTNNTITNTNTTTNNNNDDDNNATTTLEIQKLSTSCLKPRTPSLPATGASSPPLRSRRDLRKRESRKVVTNEAGVQTATLLPMSSLDKAHLDGPVSRASTSLSSPTESEKQSRIARAAIAAQACETCRARKSKCDEQRPKCSLCRRLNVECRYREPQPTKKDKSIQQIQGVLGRIEQKVDAIGRAVNPRSLLFDIPSGEPSSSRRGGIMDPGMSPFSPALEQAEMMSQDLPPVADVRLPLEVPLSTSLQHLTAPHRVLLWPAIYTYLQRSGMPTLEDFEAISREGTSWFLALEVQKNPNTLPTNASLPSQAAGNGHDLQRVQFPNLSRETMNMYTETFFNTYNVFYPLLDQEHFERTTLADVFAGGFGYGDYNSVIALLVFALGKMAYEGVYAQPVEMVENRTSGIRGGTLMRPPGLDIFNEARRRLGFLSTQFTLENIQILQLSA